MLNLRNNQTEMRVRPNLIIFIIFLLLPFFLTSCNKDKNDVIPDVYVDFNISLNDVEFSSLTAPLTSAYVSASTNNIGLYAAGYGNNGIIVFRYVEDEFLAYDRTCPHDFKVNNKSVQINIIDDIYAICPECSTKYALPSYGTPASGIGQYPLKNYKTAFNSPWIHVWNY
jgi:nitrite reductase/ring-hydroxylating ferredoxin subunit